MIRSCLIALLWFGVVIVGYQYWLGQTFPWGMSWWVAGVAAFVSFCGVGAVWKARGEWRDAARVDTAEQDLDLVDGQLVTVVGTIEPVGEAIDAPFSGEPCIACEYDLTTAARVAAAAANENSTPGSDFTGFIMTPAVVRTLARNVRLLGFPAMENFEQAPVVTVGSAARARKFLKGTVFEDRTGTKMLGILSVFSEIWGDDDGSVQKHLRLSNLDVETIFPSDDGSGPGLPRMVERRVPVGVPVVAIGHYQLAADGLRAPTQSGPPVRLIQGSAEEIAKFLRKNATAHLIGGTIALIVLHAALFGALAAYRAQQKPAAVGMAADLR